MKLENKLQSLAVQENKILHKIEIRNQKRKIKCASCPNSHEIKTLDCIQTHWYTAPYGCTGGDHWSYGELQYVCPTTKIVNRLLFDNYDVPYENRSKYAHDPEAQFARNYKHLFKSVIDEYNEKHDTVNNYYVDKNRKKFGLVEKTVT